MKITKIVGYIAGTIIMATPIVASADTVSFNDLDRNLTVHDQLATTVVAGDIKESLIAAKADANVSYDASVKTANFGHRRGGFGFNSFNRGFGGSSFGFGFNNGFSSVFISNGFNSGFGYSPGFGFNSGFGFNRGFSNRRFIGSRGFVGNRGFSSRRFSGNRGFSSRGFSGRRFSSSRFRR